MWPMGFSFYSPTHGHRETILIALTKILMTPKVKERGVNGSLCENLRVDILELSFFTLLTIFSPPEPPKPCE